MGRHNEPHRSQQDGKKTVLHSCATETVVNGCNGSNAMPFWRDLGAHLFTWSVTSRLPVSIHTLSQNLFHHLAVDVGEAKVAALVAVGEALVVDAELVQECGL